jgi:hypothetical protein
MVVLGLLDDFALRSAGGRTSNWVISLVILAIVIIMVCIAPIFQLTSARLMLVLGFLPGADPVAYDPSDAGFA